MRRFKIRFLIIIGLLTMSFTIADRQGAFKKQKLYVSGTCAVGDAVDFDYFAGAKCTNSTNLSRNDESCPSTFLIGKPVAIVYTTQHGSSFECSGFEAKFCCAVLVNDSNCGVPDKKIDAVFCYTP